MKHDKMRTKDTIIEKAQVHIADSQVLGEAIELPYKRRLKLSACHTIYSETRTIKMLA